MKQLSRERLEEIAAMQIKETSDGYEHAPSAYSGVRSLEIVQMARQLLAGVGEVVECWACKQDVEVSAIGDCDGYCPNCGNPIDLNDEPYAAPPAPVAPDTVSNREELPCEHVRREVNAGGNTWIQCSKQAYDRAKSRGDMVRELYERPQSSQQDIPDAWIPCGERMPEPNIYVLVSNGVWVGQGLYNDAIHLEEDERWQDEHQEFINLLHHPVTHWQPLPAPPKDGV